jgi:hypothetical protein
MMFETCQNCGDHVVPHQIAADGFVVQRISTKRLGQFTARRPKGSPAVQELLAAPDG